MERVTNKVMNCDTDTVTNSRANTLSWPTKVGRVLLWLEPFWMALLFPSLLLRELFWDPWIHPWLIAATFLFWPLRLLIDHRLAPRTPLNYPIYLLLLWIPVGIWMARDLNLAWQAAGVLVLGITTYTALLNWPPTQKYPWLVACAIIVCGLLLTAVGPELLLRVPTEFFTFTDEVAQSKPIDFWGLGETINPNVLAGALLLPIPLLVALAVRTSWTKRRWFPPLLLIPALFMVFILVLVQSRGSYLALILALMIVIAMRWPLAGVAMFITMVATAITLAFSDTILLLDAFGSDGSVTSFSARLDIWQSSLLALRDYAFTGVGLGSFILVLPFEYPADFWTPATLHAHNLFLQIGMDLGVPGMILYGWLLIQAFRMQIEIIRNDGYESAHDTDTHEVIGLAEEPFTARRSSSQWRQRQRLRVHARRSASLRWCLAAGTMGTLIAMLIHGLVDAVTWGTKLAFLPWLFYVLIALIWLQPTKRLK